MALEWLWLPAWGQLAGEPCGEGKLHRENTQKMREKLISTPLLDTSERMSQFEVLCPEVSFLPSLPVFGRTRDTHCKPLLKGRLSPLAAGGSEQNPGSAPWSTASSVGSPSKDTACQEFWKIRFIWKHSSRLQPPKSGSFRCSLRFSPGLGRAACVVARQSGPRCGRSSTH